MKRLFFTILLIVSFQSLVSQENYVPSDENLKAREWFEDAKFGLFIHWGVYSVLGDGEWVMNNQNISLDAYEKFPEKGDFFMPYFEKLAGTRQLRIQVEAGWDEDKIRASWQKELNLYLEKRAGYLIYD